MAFRFEQSSAGIVALLKSAGVAAVLHTKAERMASAARAAAPVKTGAYRAGIKVVDEIHRDRAAARVYATDRKSQIIEARLRVLGRAFDAGRG